MNLGSDFDPFWENLICKEIVEILLQNNADVNAYSNGYGGGTALDIAKRKGHNDIIDLLSIKHKKEFWQYFVSGYQSIYDGMKIIIKEGFEKISSVDD